MQNRLAGLRRRRAAGDHGFTLIELLVVVVIIGILIAIAIPVYLNYQKGAKDKSAASDLRNAVAVLELCNSDNSYYPKGVRADGGLLTDGGCPNQTINLSPGTTITYYPGSSAKGIGRYDSYLATTTNSGGSGKIYCYASATGGSIVTVDQDPGRYGRGCTSGPTAVRLPDQPPQSLRAPQTLSPLKSGSAS